MNVPEGIRQRYAKFRYSQIPGIDGMPYEETARNMRHLPGADEAGCPGPLRSARFVCACAVAWPDGTVKTILGKMEGRIAYRPAGSNGFGYDPVFWLPEYGKTSAEISPQEKNAISHRGKAFRAMHDYLAGKTGR